jgi:F0F1-type ATP synthase alpha subunit
MAAFNTRYLTALIF